MDHVKSLEAFLEYKKKLDNSRINDESDYEKEFKIIRDRSLAYKSESKYKSEEGTKAANAKKNRFKDILPYDCTRVPLDCSAGSDYLNANFIQGITGSKTYIATQGPMPHTVNDFWHMLWQYHIGIVVMACNEFENGKQRCHCYWPRNASEVAEFADIQVRLVDSWVRGVDNQTMCRELRVSKDGEERQVWQFHYQGWPDYGVPEHSHDILQMLDEARSKQPHDNIPITVHCSAGCGRTGTIIAIDYARCLLNTKKFTTDFSVLEMVDHMRQQRPALVQAIEQYIFVYQAIGEMCERQLRLVRGTPLYENMLIKSKPEMPVKEVSGGAAARSATLPQLPEKKNSANSLSSMSGAELDQEVLVQTVNSAADRPTVQDSTTVKSAADRPTPLPKPHRYPSVSEASNSPNGDVSSSSVVAGRQSQEPVGSSQVPMSQASVSQALGSQTAVSNAVYTAVCVDSDTAGIVPKAQHADTVYTVVHRTSKQLPEQRVNTAPQSADCRPSVGGQYQMVAASSEYAEIADGGERTGHLIVGEAGLSGTSTYAVAGLSGTSTYAVAGRCASTDESAPTYEAYEVNPLGGTLHSQRTSPDVYHQGHLMNFPNKVAKPKYATIQPTLLQSRGDDTR